MKFTDVLYEKEQFESCSFSFYELLITDAIYYNERMGTNRTFNWDGVEYGSAEYHRLWRLANNEHSRKWHRDYDRKMYELHPERERARRQRYIDSNPAKTKAHQLVYRTVKAGKLSKQPCRDCGSIDVIAHHEDYSKPLDVIWLCEVHHKARHKKLLRH